MHSGLLRHRVELVKRGREPLGAADSFETFVLVGRRYAAITTVKGSDRIAGVNAGGGATHRITIRFDPELYEKLEAGDFVRHADRRASILDIENVDQKNVWLDLLCEDDREDP